MSCIDWDEEDDTNEPDDIESDDTGDELLCDQSEPLGNWSDEDWNTLLTEE